MIDCFGGLSQLKQSNPDSARRHWDSWTCCRSFLCKFVYICRHYLHFVMIWFKGTRSREGGAQRVLSEKRRKALCEISVLVQICTYSVTIPVLWCFKKKKPNHEWFGDQKRYSDLAQYTNSVKNREQRFHQSRRCVVTNGQIFK